MYLSLNAFRPTFFEVLKTPEGFVFSFNSPLSTAQVLDVFNTPGVSRGLVSDDGFSEVEKLLDTFISGDLTVRGTSTGCIVEVFSTNSPFFSLASGIDVLW